MAKDKYDKLMWIIPLIILIIVWILPIATGIKVSITIFGILFLLNNWWINRNFKKEVKE